MLHFAHFDFAIVSMAGAPSFTLGSHPFLQEIMMGKMGAREGTRQGRSGPWREGVVES